MRATFVNCLAILSFAGLAVADGQQLPVVDLGYQRHQASCYDAEGGFYNFSNIRYAAPPVGNLRWAPPHAPARDRRNLQTGDVGRICPQANPAWGLIAAQFIPEYLRDPQGFNVSNLPTPSSSEPPSLPPQDPRTTEDCLFLDVAVPYEVYKNRRTSKAPVLVWIHGGGYTTGSKDSSGNPAGLLARSGTETSGRVIFVSINYRLGAFGFLSGSTLRNDGVANAGLLDQRFALEWIQKHIRQFGGDPNMVTVVGESAGGGSIMHQITAFGGAKGRVPFHQAIPQSPGWSPVTPAQEEKSFQRFLELSGVRTLNEARQLPSPKLIEANIRQVGLDSPYGTSTYGPTVDGVFVPDHPGKLLLEGRFDRSLRVMVGHNSNEGLLFTSPYVQDNNAFAQYLQSTLPGITDEALNVITTQLYPPVFDGSYGYRDQIQRTALTIAESIFNCNTFYLSRAYDNETYSYIFAVPPALHGQDVPYTFFEDDAPNGNQVNETVAIALQEFITSFAGTGEPDAGGLKGVPVFEMYGPDASVLELDVTGIEETIDDAANARCLWWQRAEYF